MDGQRSFDDYRMPDELWEQMEELLPGYRPSPKGGRPRADLRGVADAIFYRLRTGCQWNAIPPELAPGSTAHDYFQQWGPADFFSRLLLKLGKHFARLVRVGLDQILEHDLLAVIQRWRTARHQWSASEKMRIVLAGMEAGTPAGQYYVGWALTTDATEPSTSSNIALLLNDRSSGFGSMTVLPPDRTVPNARFLRACP